jgi:hypothetical protein
MTDQEPDNKGESGLPRWARTVLMTLGVLALAALGVVVVVVGLIIGACGGKC